MLHDMLCIIFFMFYNVNKALAQLKWVCFLVTIDSNVVIMSAICR